MPEPDAVPPGHPPEHPSGPSAGLDSPAGAPLEVSGLSAGYDGVAVVHEVDLAVGPGEVVALLGSNGAGKSTTLLTISGLLPAMSGSITFGGRSLGGRRATSTRAAALARSGLLHVPEDRGLFFDLTVAEHLRLGRRRGRPSLTDDEVLAWFPALARIVDRRAGLLSGGEQQMLALARALVCRPEMLLIDEMSLGLAPIVVEQLLPVLRQVAGETGCGILLVEQHVGLALEVADRAYLMDRGRIVTSGSAADMAIRADEIERGYFGEAAG